MTLDHPDDEPVDDIGEYLKKITFEAEPVESDNGFGYHGSGNGIQSDGKGGR